MTDDLKEAQSDLFRKVGRNVVLLQYLEHLLKLTLTSNCISGYLSELPLKYERYRAFIHKRTLGQLVREYCDPNTLATHNEPTELNEAWISLTITFEGAQDDQKVFASLNEVVAERNDLIHHFLPRWDVCSVDSSRMLETYLDQQRDRILPVVAHLEGRIQSIHKAMKQFATVVADHDFLQQFLDKT